MADVTETKVEWREPARFVRAWHLHHTQDKKRLGWWGVILAILCLIVLYNIIMAPTPSEDDGAGFLTTLLPLVVIPVVLGYLQQFVGWLTLYSKVVLTETVISVNRGTGDKSIEFDADTEFSWQIKNRLILLIVTKKDEREVLAIPDKETARRIRSFLLTLKEKSESSKSLFNKSLGKIFASLRKNKTDK